MGDLAKSLAGSDSAPKNLLALVLNAHAPTIVRGSVSSADCEEALAIVRRWKIPLKEMEPAGMVRDDSADLGYTFAGMTAKLADALRPLGIKIAPTMPGAQAGAWLAAMITALSDMPPRISIRGAQEAIHKPMQFLNEIEGVVRERAEDLAARYNLAQSRLERMQREIAEATKPSRPLLTGPPAPELTQADVDTMSGSMRRIGLGCGALFQDGDIVRPAPPGQKRSPFDGQPFYCTTCNLGFGEFLVCEGSGCVLESPDEAQARRERGTP